MDGILFENNYRSYLEEGNQLIQGAFEFINQIQREYDLYIVTNGISKTQDKRLRNAGLHALFKDIFVSEDTGFQKPMKSILIMFSNEFLIFPLKKDSLLGIR